MPGCGAPVYVAKNEEDPAYVSDVRAFSKRDSRLEEDFCSPSSSEISITGGAMVFSRLLDFVKTTMDSCNVLAARGRELNSSKSCTSAR